MTKPENSKVQYFLAKCKDQLAIDRIPVQPAQKNQTLVLLAAVLSISVFAVLGWGESTVIAFDILLNSRGYYTATPIGDETIDGQLLSIAADVILAWLAYLALCAFRGRTRTRPKVSTTSKTFAVAILATGAGFAAVQVLTTITILVNLDLPRMNFPHPEVETTAALVLSIIDGAMAGPTEEIALMGLVVVSLRKAGQGWPTIVAVAVLVRVPFHMYYGWEAIGLAVWAVLIVLLYRRTNCLLGIVLEHVAWNITSDISAYELLPAAVLYTYLSIVICAAVLILAMKLKPWEKPGRLISSPNDGLRRSILGAKKN
ncbi:CPBP family glutamic-type intramembrane protease [Glutamicibacter arilaitensis]|uniref:CPBP family glutamic-type intramembrane protease n=1 Tax=Glutamicibacter arilaitensis TaxID=256701 RepID=UPI003FCFA0AC